MRWLTTTRRNRFANGIVHLMVVVLPVLLLLLVLVSWHLWHAQ